MTARLERTTTGCGEMVCSGRGDNQRKAKYLLLNAWYSTVVLFGNSAVLKVHLQTPPPPLTPLSPKCVFITSSARKREAPSSHKNIQMLIANFVVQTADWLVGDSLEQGASSDLWHPPGPKWLEQTNSVEFSWAVLSLR